ncbi:MAG: FtsW/RodA/SpoVE family cell cycle protein, partial [Sphingomonadales bacterium]|nr:FtsW/RodA/SpoVE family cell cycle protein [Sphingomonadales bacterium]
MAFARSDDSLISRWWWTVDRWMLVALGALMAAGVILIFGASTPVAERLGLSSFHFATRQVVFLVAAIGVMFVVSLMSIKMVRRLSVLMLPVFALLVVLTLFIGPEIKGATRWLSLGGLGLQPSEFLKPSFIVVSAWMLSESLQTPSFPGKKIALGLFAAIAALLLLQPDFGQTMLMGLVFGAQFVMAGMPLVWVFGVGALGVSVITAAYWFMPHVQKRIDAFLDPASNDTYQVDQALNAFKSGGIFGRGPGEGIVKKSLPDAHADYIFAV